MQKVYDFITSSQFLVPLVILATCLVAGIITEKVVLRLLKMFTAKSKWIGFTPVRKGLRGMITLWFVIGGLYGAIRFVNLSPTALSYYHKAFVVLIIFSITMAAARVFAGVVDLYVRKAEGAVPSTTILGNILRIVIFITGFTVMLTYLGVPITPIITALGIGGFAFALAFQDTLGNLFSGLHILASRLVRPGDYVRLDSGEEGYVVDVTWRNTTVRTLPNNMVVIPNSKLASSVITNYNQPFRKMAVLVEVGVSYSSDLERVEEVTIEVAREVQRSTPGGVADFEPFIRYHSLGDFRIDFTVILFAQEYVDQYMIKHDFLKKLHRRYREEGIEIPFPTRTIITSDDREDILSETIASGRRS